MKETDDSGKKDKKPNETKLNQRLPLEILRHLFEVCGNLEGY